MSPEISKNNLEPNQLKNKYDALKLNNQLCFRLYAVSRNMTRLYGPLLEKYNITYPQYIILLALFEKETMDFKELSNLVDLKTGTMTPIIQKLVETGYVSKKSNPLDKRRIDVSLTNEGYLLKEKIVDVPYKLAELIKMTEPDFYKLISQLDDLSNLLTQAQEDKKEK